MDTEKHTKIDDIAEDNESYNISDSEIHDSIIVDDQNEKKY